jgi:hypothetical protein
VAFGDHDTVPIGIALGRWKLCQSPLAGDDAYHLAAAAKAAQRVKEVAGYCSYQWLHFCSFQNYDSPWPFENNFVRMDWLLAQII